MERVTKKQQVLNHLRVFGFITSWQAIERYGATRLAAIIFKLRDEGHDIKSHILTIKDRNGNTTSYTNYELKK